jgi:hypothetical protein
MNSIAFLRFARLMWPIVSEILRDLFRRHSGDAVAATVELRRIRDYGLRGEAAEEDFDERIDALKKQPPSS